MPSLLACRLPQLKELHPSLCGHGGQHQLDKPAQVSCQSQLWRDTARACMLVTLCTAVGLHTMECLPVLQALRVRQLLMVLLPPPSLQSLTQHMLHTCRLTQPDEIYNLAAQSHVKVSFELPEYTAAASGMVSVRLRHRCVVPMLLALQPAHQQVCLQQLTHNIICCCSQPHPLSCKLWGPAKLQGGLLAPPLMLRPSNEYGVSVTLCPAGCSEPAGGCARRWPG